MRGQKGARVYLRELKSSVRQQRRDPVGTFGHVTVELGRRLYRVLRHDLVDVLYSSLRDKTHCSMGTVVAKETEKHRHCKDVKEEWQTYPHNFKNDHVSRRTGFEGIDL